MFLTDSKFALIDIKCTEKEAIPLSIFVFSDISAYEIESQYLKFTFIVSRNWFDVMALIFRDNNFCSYGWKVYNSYLPRTIWSEKLGACLRLAHRKKNWNLVGIGLTPNGSSVYPPFLCVSLSILSVDSRFMSSQLNMCQFQT